MISRSEPSPPAFCAPILFFLFLRKKRIAAASEEASSIPFPPGRRKLHIRSLLPSQIVTVSLGHNLAIWNFTTPHAILMMAVISLPANTAKSKTSMRRKSRARLWSMESPENHPKGSLVVSFLFLLDEYVVWEEALNACLQAKYIERKSEAICVITNAGYKAVE